MQAIDELAGRFNLHLYARLDGEATRLRTRMFAPLAGVLEDPATGSANATLAALLTSLAPGDNVDLAYDIAQGEEMGRPSRLLATARKTAEGPVLATVAGTCVAVMRGTGGGVVSGPLLSEGAADEGGHRISHPDGSERTGFVNITPQVEAGRRASGIQEGLAAVQRHAHHRLVFINDDEPGLHQDYEGWLEKRPRSTRRPAVPPQPHRRRQRRRSSEAPGHGPRSRGGDHRRASSISAPGNRSSTANSTAGGRSGCW